jgi:hypothetical protein
MILQQVCPDLVLFFEEITKTCRKAVTGEILAAAATGAVAAMRLCLHRGSNKLTQGRQWAKRACCRGGQQGVGEVAAEKTSTNDLFRCFSSFCSQ